MRPKEFLALAILAFASLPAWPASAAKGKGRCPADQIKVGGKCVTACPTEGRFEQPDSCECPPGFGKILYGSGAGQCDRLRCPARAEMTDALCECPAGYEKRDLGKRKSRCEARTEKK